MEFPGERALLKKFTLQQGSVEPSIGNLYASLGSTRAIARGLVKTKLELRTQDGPVFWADIGAFILNRPSEPSVIEDAVVLKPKANWQAVVTGTSRGFGANVTAALATRGIPTIGLQRSQSSHPGRVVCDLSRRSDVKKVAARVCADATPVKLLILNAASPLIEQTVDSEHEERITSFIQREVGLALNPLVAFIPELSMNRGTCVLISTAFLDAEGNWTAPPNVSHYLAVKSAEEALMIGAAQAYPDAAFVIARLPPMITTFAFRTSIEAAYEPRPVAELLLDFLEGDLQKGAVTIFPSSMFVTRT
jgi:NADP-dependent 3-hydroxy acid dehydrogenase YdfG